MVYIQVVKNRWWNVCLISVWDDKNGLITWVMLRSHAGASFGFWKECKVREISITVTLLLMGEGWA